MRAERCTASLLVTFARLPATKPSCNEFAQVLRKCMLVNCKVSAHQPWGLARLELLRFLFCFNTAVNTTAILEQRGSRGHSGRNPPTTPAHLNRADILHVLDQRVHRSN